MGAKNKAPDPKPEMTIPLAMPLLSGNHSIKASKLKKIYFRYFICQIAEFVYIFYKKCVLRAAEARFPPVELQDLRFSEYRTLKNPI